MELDRLRAALRPRTGWESVDLGFALARHWFLPLWALWWIAMLPVAAVLLLPLRDRPDLWLLALWWLKPLYESLLLLWLSRALFGDEAPVADTARQIRRAFPPPLWPGLLWRRLGPARSFAMPMTLLERLSGRSRRERLRVLRDGSGVATWLTIICVQLETLLLLSALLLIAFMIPDHLPNLDLRAAVFDDSSMLYWLGTLCTLAAMSVIAPFYVAAGFALYLGRRTDLEAWDLELRFRHSLARASNTTPKGSSTTRPDPGLAMLLPAALALVLVGTATAPESAQAPAAPSPETARSLVEQVLSDADFGSTRHEEAWVYIGDGAPVHEGDDDPAAWLPIDFILALATALKWGLGLAAGAALLLLGYRLWMELHGMRIGRRQPDRVDGPPPVVSEGARPLQSLAADLDTAVRALLAARDARGALALLYRAQIAHLRANGLDIPDSATEADCIEAVGRAATSDQLAWFQSLTRLWQNVAYAHHPVDVHAIGQLLTTHPSVTSMAQTQ
ncbi:MAG: DUF4129 domain-containing protein [Thiohalocapsa sp.]